MASVSTDANGNRTIQFKGLDGKRRSVRCGPIPKKAAESLKLRIEELSSLAQLGQPMGADLSAWVAGIGDDLAEKLAAVKLIPERQQATLGAFLDDYRASHFHEWKAGTRTQNEQRCQNLTEVFGADRPLHTITEADARQMKEAMHADGLADATIHRRIRAYRNYFAEAARRNLIRENPFEGIRCAEGDMTERQQYVPVEDVQKLLAIANPCWRTIIALSRFGGLRTPSETLMLRWDKVDFGSRRMVIEDIKTDTRVMPITSTLLPYLEESARTAPHGTVYVVHGQQADHYRETSNSEGGWLNTNLRTVFLKLVSRAGLEQWPKPFHNMRSSCETDLNGEFPSHVVAKWMGHSLAVAEKHYLQIRDAEMDRATRFEMPLSSKLVQFGQGFEPGTAPPPNYAVQNPVQSGAVKGGQRGTDGMGRSEKPLESPLVSAPDAYCTNVQITRQGFEP
jgi:integrase